MKAKSFLTALLAGAALFPLTAQVEVAPPEKKAEWLKAYQLLTRENSIWSDHANRMKNGTENRRPMSPVWLPMPKRERLPAVTSTIRYPL